MSFDLTAVYTITAPTSVDGRGEIAVVNDPTSGNFVGYLSDFTRSATVRSSTDDIVEGHGAVFGSFYYGSASHTLEVSLARASTWAASFARRDKLLRATEAMSADGTIVWTESGGVAKRLLFRREQYPQGPDHEGKMLVAITSADPRVYANTAQTGSSPKTNAGTASSPPTFTITPSGGNVVITNTTSGLGSPTLTLQVGTGYLVSGTSYVVDFGAKTVKRASDGVSFYQAVVFPATWWEVVPGANTWTVTNTSSASISFRDAWV